MKAIIISNVKWRNKKKMANECPISKSIGSFKIEIDRGEVGCDPGEETREGFPTNKRD